jgi:NADH:ubiquinone oxidoreductase subunit B-like Fe-S oxidoreductase
MGTGMKANKKMAKMMEKVYSQTLTATSIVAIGKIINDMGMENILIQLVIYIKAIG